MSPEKKSPNAENKPPDDSSSSLEPGVPPIGLVQDSSESTGSGAGSSTSTSSVSVSAVSASASSLPENSLPNAENKSPDDSLSSLDPGVPPIGLVQDLSEATGSGAGSLTSVTSTSAGTAFFGSSI